MKDYSRYLKPEYRKGAYRLTNGGYWELTEFDVMMS